MVISLVWTWSLSTSRLYTYTQMSIVFLFRYIFKIMINLFSFYVGFPYSCFCNRGGMYQPRFIYIWRQHVYNRKLCYKKSHRRSSPSYIWCMHNYKWIFNYYCCASWAWEISKTQIWAYKIRRCVLYCPKPRSIRATFICNSSYFWITYYVISVITII